MNEPSDQTEPQNPNETTIIWASQEKLYEIDWFGVWYELKNLKLPWHCMKFSEFLKSFFIAFVQFYTCNYDMFTDGQLAYQYFNREDYI